MVLGDWLDVRYDLERRALRIAHLRELSGQVVELAVRVVDAREIRSSCGLTYHYLIIPLGLPARSGLFVLLFLILARPLIPNLATPLSTLDIR